jgi:hypothetical protein
MKDTKLSVALLDNAVSSAVVNIGKTGAYIEVWVDGTDISICLINDVGDIVRSIDEPLTTLKGEAK